MKRFIPEESSPAWKVEGGAPATPFLTVSQELDPPLLHRVGRLRFGSRLGSCVAKTLLAALAFVASACRNDMYNQPKLKPLAESPFFRDGASARPLPAHVVARETNLSNPAWSSGLTNGVYVTQLPMPLTPELLQRGRERYDIYCAVCHGAAGEGNGMIPQRGFPAPPTFHSARLRNAPIGHFFDVISNGYGVMYSYAARVSVDDRWAIAAYLRALQLSRNTSATDLSDDERKTLEAQP